MAEMKKRWYVLRTIGGKEKKVKEYIENEIASLGLQDYVSQVLVPAEKVYQVRNGKKYSSERNLYPGYVLIEAALVGEIPHILRDITNVIGFLGETKGGDPVPMRQAEVLSLIHILGETMQAINHLNEVMRINPENIKAKAYLDMINGILDYYCKDLLNP